MERAREGAKKARTHSRIKNTPTIKKTAENKTRKIQQRKKKPAASRNERIKNNTHTHGWRKLLHIVLLTFCFLHLF